MRAKPFDDMMKEYEQSVWNDVQDINMDDQYWDNNIENEQDNNKKFDIKIEDYFKDYVEINMEESQKRRKDVGWIGTDYI